MIKIMPREPEQQMVSGKIMKMKRVINPKPMPKIKRAAVGFGGDDRFPLDNKKFNEFIKNLKNKKITDDIAKKINQLYNNEKFQDIYKTINKILKK